LTINFYEKVLIFITIVLFSSKYLLRVKNVSSHAHNTVPPSFSHGVHHNFKWPVNWLSSSCLLPWRTTQGCISLGKMRKTKEEKGLMGRRDKARFKYILLQTDLLCQLNWLVFCLKICLLPKKPLAFHALMVHIFA